jgi:hypothetical protein
MKHDLGDLFEIFPDLPGSFRLPSLEERVQAARALMGTARRRLEENARARKAQIRRAEEMRKRKRTGF